MIDWQDISSEWIDVFKESVEYDFSKIRKTVYTGIIPAPINSSGYKFVSDISSVKYIDTDNKYIRQLYIYSTLRRYILRQYRMNIKHTVDMYYIENVLGAINGEYRYLVWFSNIQKYIEPLCDQGLCRSICKNMYKDEFIINSFDDIQYLPKSRIEMTMMSRSIPNEAILLMMMDM